MVEVVTMLEEPLSPIAARDMLMIFAPSPAGAG